MKKLREFLKKYKVELIVTLVLPAIGLGLFIFNFRSQYLSDDIARWGQFGDYFNWIISWFIGSANLVLLYRLTIIARSFQKEDTAKQASSEFIKNIISSIDQNRDAIVAAWSNLSDAPFGFKAPVILGHTILRVAKSELDILCDNDTDKVNLLEMKNKINNCETAIKTLSQVLLDPEKKDLQPKVLTDFIKEISELKLLLYQEIKRS